MSLRKIDYAAAQRRHDRLEPLRRFTDRALDRIFILTCWALLAFMGAVFAGWALSAVV